MVFSPGAHNLVGDQEKLISKLVYKKALYGDINKYTVKKRQSQGKESDKGLVFKCCD